MNELCCRDALGIEIDDHGKMPDVVVWLKHRNWLVLIEAVTSHGPMNALRKANLEHLFRGPAGLVFVTTFPDMATYVRYAHEVAWETDVWVADATRLHPLQRRAISRADLTQRHTDAHLAANDADSDRLGRLIAVIRQRPELGFTAGPDSRTTCAQSRGSDATPDGRRHAMHSGHAACANQQANCPLAGSCSTVRWFTDRH